MTLLAERLGVALARPAVPFLSGDPDFAGTAHPVDRALVPAAVLVPIVDRPAPTLILTTRNSALRRHAGQIAFPGGRVDATDADHVATALREAEEEIALSPHHVRVLGTSSAYRTGTGYSIQPVVGIVPPDLPLRPCPDEVADLFEVPLAFVLDPAHHQMREAMHEGQLRRYYVIEWQGRHIWGATAGMIVTLAARLA